MAVSYNPLTGLSYDPNPVTAPKGPQPTVTIGGAPAGYKPTKTLLPSVTIGGAPAGYTMQDTPNYITGANIPGANTQTPPPDTKKPEDTPTPKDAPGNTGFSTGLNGELLYNGKPYNGVYNGKTYKDGYATGTTVKQVTETDLNTGPTKTQVDSIAAMKALLSSYGIGDLGDAITNAVIKGYSTDTIQLIMQDPNSNDPLAVAFQVRFPANKARLAAGKSVLSPAEYLRAERSYTEVLQSYGVSSLATREKLNQFISNDISATEVADRVGLAINRVQNADADTKKALAEYYPMLNQADIVNAVLDPKEGLPALQRKIQIGEIGGAALTQGIKTAEGKTNIKMGAETLANLGVTKEQARQGFQTVAEVTPRAEFLSQISTGEDYTQLSAEQEAFQGLASAKRARLALTEQEKARFGGASGVNKTSLTRQTKGLI